MSELVLDSNIRQWVFLPIVVVTFLTGVVRHYLTILLSTQNDPTPLQIQDSQALLRSRMLRQNGGYICPSAFLMRKKFFNDEQYGYFKTEKRQYSTTSLLSDPRIVSDIVKGNVSNIAQMMVIGGVINWVFSGFLATKVPFPLTLRFKPMLQRGIELTTLDPSWVSSASWYFLNVFGLGSISQLVLGEESNMEIDPTMEIANALPQDLRAVFKSEWEAIQIYDHNCILNDISHNLLNQ